MVKHLFIVLLLIVQPFLLNAHDEPILDFSALKEYELGPYLYYYPDATATSIKDLIALKHQGKFLPWKKEKVFNIGYTNHICCVSFKVYNSETYAQVALFSVYDDLRNLQLYQLKKDSVIKFPKQSYYQHNSSRSYDQRLLSYRVMVDAGDTSEFFALLDNRDANLYTPMDFGTFEYFMPYEVEYHWSYALFLGVMIFALFCSIVMIVLIKKRVFIAYSLFIFSWLIVFLQEEFFLGYFLSESVYNKVSLFIQSPFFLLALLCNFKVISYLGIIDFKSLRLKKHINYILAFFLVFFVFAQTVALFFHSNYELLQCIVRTSNAFNVFVEGFIFLKILYDLFFKRKIETLLYFLFSIVYTIGCFNFNLNSMAILNINIFKPNGIVVGVSIEIIYFAIIIISRQIKIMKSESDLKLQMEKQKTEHQFQIILAEEEERRRISREIHDHLGGLVGALKLSFTGRNDENTLKLIDKVNEDVRNIAHRLMPLNIEHEGLFSCFEKYILGMTNHSIQFTVKVSGSDSEMHINIQVECFRILSELVMNVTRHSKATSCHIELIEQNSQYSFSVADNGIGYNAQTRSGLGLLNIQERLSRIGGQLKIHSSENNGSKFTFTLIQKK